MGTDWTSLRFQIGSQPCSLVTFKSPFTKQVYIFIFVVETKRLKRMKRAGKNKEGEEMDTYESLV